MGEIQIPFGAVSSAAADLADRENDLVNYFLAIDTQPIGTVVAKAEARSVDLSGLTLAEMQAVEPRITQGVFDVLTVEASVRSRTSYGGTSPVNVAAMAAEWKAKLA